LREELGEDMWDRLSLDPRLRRRAADIGHLVTRRLADREALAEAVRRSSSQSLLGGIWEPTGLANGMPGLAVTFAIVADDPAWDVDGLREASVELLLETIRLSQDQPYATYDMFSGTSGLALALELVRPVEPRLARPLASVLSRTVDLLEADPLPGRGTRAGYAPEYYDVVGGSAGVLGASLAVDVAGSEALVTDATRIAGAATLSLTDLFTPRPDEPDCWWVAPDLMPVVERLEAAPDGYFDCGAAHGIAGVVSALSLALESSGADTKARAQHLDGRSSQTRAVRVALEHAVEWLLAARTEDAIGVNWPSLVPVGVSGAEAEGWSHGRTAWCYGAPGVLVALASASRALGRDDVRPVVSAGVSAIVDRLRKSSGRLSTPTLCHGEAGVIAALAHLACEHGFSEALEGIDLLGRALLDRFDPDSVFGFYDVEPGDRAVDNPTLLNGAAGVVLSLHLLATGRRPRWTRFMVLG
jgi:lantibiotic biosynthesis protein